MSKKVKRIKEMARIAKEVKDEGKQRRFCFVIMSFSSNPILESYYEEAVKPTLESFGLECVRVDQENFDGTIITQIRANIKNCRIMIADFTEDRPNCYFELGFGVALGKDIIFQRLNAPKYNPNIPFDVKDYPHILYTTIKDLREKLTAKLIFYMKKSADRRD